MPHLRGGLPLFTELPPRFFSETGLPPNPMLGHPVSGIFHSRKLGSMPKGTYTLTASNTGGKLQGGNLQLATGLAWREELVEAYSVPVDTALRCGCAAVCARRCWGAGGARGGTGGRLRRLLRSG